MVAVERIATTTEIVVMPLRGQHVVGLVVEPAKRDRWPAVIALAGVIENDIKNDLDACSMEGTYHCLEFVALHAC